MTVFARFSLLFLLTLLIACGDRASPEAEASAAPEAPPQAGSCHTEAVGVCQDFHGPGHTPNEVQFTCVGQRLTYARGACPLTERVGTCLLFADKPIASRLRYYGRFAPGVAGAQQQCEGKLQGQWFPG